MFDAARGALGDFPVVAENLGLITPPVERLRHELDMPGTFVLQFAFSDDLVNPQPEPHDDATVVYTGTHDNDTTVGWWSTAAETERERRARRGGRPAPPRDRAALDADPAGTRVSRGHVDRARPGRPRARPRARLNVPGRAGGNWAWRLHDGQLDAALAARLRDATEAAGRH